jgi:hypothetical protein
MTRLRLAERVRFTHVVRIYSFYNDSPLNLLLVLPIQVLQQHIPILLPPFISTHIVAPAPYGACQPSWHVRLIRNLSNGMEEGSDGKHDTARPRESSERLSLGTEVVVLDGRELRRRGP